MRLSSLLPTARLVRHPSFLPVLCVLWVWRCGNGSAVTGFLCSGAAGLNGQLDGPSQDGRHPSPGCVRALFPVPRGGVSSLWEWGPRRGRGRGGPRARGACTEQRERGRRQLFCPPTHPSRIPAVGGVATALPLPASCAQEQQGPTAS